MRSKLPGAWALAPWFLFLACAGCGADQKASDSPGAEVADEAEIVDSVSTERVEVEADRLTFPETSATRWMLSVDPQAQDRFLVGQRARGADSKNPLGFIRKMRAVQRDEEAGKIIVDTDPASLSDVIRDGAGGFEDEHLDLLAAPRWAPGLKPQGDGTLGGEVGLTAITLKEVNKPAGTSVGLVPKVSLTDGHFSFEPDFDVGMHWKKGKLDQFHATGKGTLDASFKLKIVLTGKVTQAVAEERELEVQILDTPPVFLPPLFVGVVPVVTSVRFSLSALCTVQAEGAVAIEVGGSFRGAVSLGARLEGGKWSPVSTFDKKVTPFEPSLSFDHARVSSRCALKPRFDLLFYDLVGPGVELSAPYVETGITFTPGDPSPWKWGVDVGLSANLKGSIKVLGKTFGDLSVPITTIPLWKREGAFAQ